MVSNGDVGAIRMPESKEKAYKDCNRHFLLDWYFVSQTLITSRKYFPPLEIYGNIPMQIV